LLIGDPPPTQGDLHFTLFGIPVRIHPFFWIVGVLLIAGEIFDARDLRTALLIFLPWIVALFLSILVHELGHALVMRAYGFSPWITLYGLGGMASYNPGQTYGARGAGTRGQVLISLAGPGAGFLFAGLVVAAVVLTGHKVEIIPFGGFIPLVVLREIVGSAAFTFFLSDILFVSVFWGLLNLMPVYPLDGGQIARELFLHANPRDGIRQSLILSIITGACLAVVGAVTLKSLLATLFFAYLAYMSYMTLQAYSGRGGWR
jgi:Zn-dependent protease